MSHSPTSEQRNTSGPPFLTRLGLSVVKIPPEVWDLILAYSLIHEPDNITTGFGSNAVPLGHCSIGRVNKASAHPLARLLKRPTFGPRVEDFYRKENEWTLFANAVGHFNADTFERNLWCPRTQISELRLMKNVTIQLDFQDCIYYTSPAVLSPKAIVDDEKVQLMRNNVMNICTVLAKAERIPVLHLTLKEMTEADNDSLLLPVLWHRFM